MQNKISAKIDNRSFNKKKKRFSLKEAKFTKCWSIPIAFEEAYNESCRFNRVKEIKLILTLNTALFHASKNRNPTHFYWKHPIWTSESHIVESKIIRALAIFLCFDCQFLSFHAFFKQYKS